MFFHLMDKALLGRDSVTGERLSRRNRSSAWANPNRDGTETSCTYTEDGASNAWDAGGPNPRRSSRKTKKRKF